MQRFVDSRKKDRWKDENLGCTTCGKKGFSATQLDVHARTCKVARARQKERKDNATGVFIWDDDPFEQYGKAASSPAASQPAAPAQIPPVQPQTSPAPHSQAVERPFTSIVNDTASMLAEDFRLEFQRIQRMRQAPARVPIVSFVRPGADWMKMAKGPQAHTTTQTAPQSYSRTQACRMGRKRSRPAQWATAIEDDHYDLSHYRFVRRQAADSGDNYSDGFQQLLKHSNMEKMVDQARALFHKLEREALPSSQQPSSSIATSQSQRTVQTWQCNNSTPMAHETKQCDGQVTQDRIYSQQQLSVGPQTPAREFLDRSQVGPSAHAQEKPALSNALKNTSRGVVAQHANSNVEIVQPALPVQPSQRFTPQIPNAANIVDAFMYAKQIPRRARVRICAPQGATVRSGIDIDQSTTVAKAKPGDVLDYDDVSVLVPGVGQEDCVPVVRLHVRLPTGSHGWVSTHGRTVDSNYALAEVIPTHPQPSKQYSPPLPKAPAAVISCPLCDQNLTALSVRAREHADEAIEREITSTSSMGSNDSTIQHVPAREHLQAHPQTTPSAARPAPPTQPTQGGRNEHVTPIAGSTAGNAPMAATVLPATVASTPVSAVAEPTKRLKLADIRIRPVLPPAESTPSTLAATEQVQQNTPRNIDQAPKITQCPLCQMRFGPNKSLAFVNSHIQNCAMVGDEW